MPSLSYRKHDENEFWNCSPVRTVTNSPANLTIIGGTTAVALLVLTTIHNSRWAVAYLLVFGIAHPQWVPALTSRQILFVLPPSL
ncbi:MAG TPA: hypothetical protein VGK96_03405 [Candidatus Sulfotelmatobacter sp.]